MKVIDSNTFLGQQGVNLVERKVQEMGFLWNPTTMDAGVDGEIEIRDPNTGEAKNDGSWKLARLSEDAVQDESPTELEALKSHFPTPRDAVGYIMDTFPIVKRKDEKQYGEYRTKNRILEIYDKMAEAMKTGKPYQTHLSPPPGPPADEHGNFLPLPEWLPDQPQPADWPPHIHPPRGCEA